MAAAAPGESVTTATTTTDDHDGKYRSGNGHGDDDDEEEEEEVSESTVFYTFNVSWNKTKYEVRLPDFAVVGGIKAVLEELTQVPAQDQKLAGFKGVPPGDDVVLSSLAIKDNMRLAMVGNRLDDRLKVPDYFLAGTSSVTNTQDDDDEVEDKSDNDDGLLWTPKAEAKLTRRVKSCEVIFINPPRPGKKLLVLDLDYTLFDMKGLAAETSLLGRPYLHEFMKSVYQDYDIVVWSQTVWRALEAKLTELGLLTSFEFKICFVLDKTSMFSIYSMYKGEKTKHEVKCLEFIWRKFTGYGWNATNTIHIDDVERNFRLNPQSGLLIKAYKKWFVHRSTDRELVYLSRYLSLLTQVPDFTTLDHSKWKTYLLLNHPQGLDL